MVDSLDNLLRRCAVRITASAEQLGTGFFVAPGLVLSCAHVVRSATGQRQAVKVEWEGRTEQAPTQALVPEPAQGDDIFPDLALLQVSWADHPCVWLDRDVQLGDYLYAFGYPQGRRAGDSLTVGSEGISRYGDGPDRELLKLKAGQVAPGFSGSPLLNLRTGGVCGVVKRTRGEHTDLGGLALRLDVVLAHFDFLRERQCHYHAADRTWEAARQQRESLLRVARTFALEDLFPLLAKAAPPLASGMRISEFQSLIEDRTKDFVGRDFVFQAIDQALGDKNFASGYIVIRGEPGIGKTALLGQLVKRRGYVHHFNVAAQNIRSARDFLTNTCAQLIVRYSLKYDALPPDMTSNSAFFDKVLRQSAQAATGPVVIAVDALDEAEEVPPQANRLYLPPSLPDGVFIIVTSRPKSDDLVITRSRVLYLDENDPHNREDIRDYIKLFLTKHQVEMEPRLAAWQIPMKVSMDEFIQTLIDRSEGNFMYLVYVLADIRDGRITHVNLGNIWDLPQGLRAYYERHWGAMRALDEKGFAEAYQPVVCYLAAAREPVSAAQVEEWTGLPLLRVQDVIRRWLPFLNEERGPGGVPLYRIYHASFQDFLREVVGLKDYHQGIALAILRKIPGFLEESPS